MRHSSSLKRTTGRAPCFPQERGNKRVLLPEHISKGSTAKTADPNPHFLTFFLWENSHLLLNWIPEILNLLT